MTLDDFLRLSQGLSTPILMGAVWIGYRVLTALHHIETKLAVMDTRIKHVEGLSNGIVQQDIR